MGGGPDYPSFPSGFPHPTPTTSYWQLPPHAITTHRTTPSLPTSTPLDYIVIGSGISGASVAYHLLSRSPSSTVLMLEARTAASGASGRNGGHVRAGWWGRFGRYCEVLGEEEAVRLAELEVSNVTGIARFVEEEKVRCDFREVETVDVFTDEEEWGDVKAGLGLREEVLRRRRGSGRLLVDELELVVRERGEAREFVDIPGIVGCVSFRAYTQNPYLLTCRILELSLEKGLNLQTNTIVTRVVKQSGLQGGSWEVETDRGTVRGSKVVMATNGYTNALHPGLAATEFLVPARNQVAAIRPGNKIEGSEVLRKTINMADFPTGDYLMSRASGLVGEGDVLYGGAKSLSRTREMNTTDDSVIHPVIGQYLRHAAIGTFGRGTWGEEGDFVREWTGIVAYTADSLPLVGEIPNEEGLWMIVGMNGHGMAMAHRCAEGLVSTMTEGREPEWFPKSLRIGRAFDDTAAHDDGMRSRGKGTDAALQSLFAQ